MGPARSRRSVDVAEIAEESQGLPPLARHVLLLIALGVEPTYAELAALTGASPRSLRRAVRGSNGALACHAGGPLRGQIVRASEILRGQNGRAGKISADNMAAQALPGNRRGPKPVGACVENVIRRATCNNVVKHKTRQQGVWGKTPAELLEQFPAILKAFPSVQPRIIAERVALSATQSSRPGAYFATLMSGDATLSKKQRQSVEAIVDGLLKGTKPAVAADENVSEVHACPRCASKRLQPVGVSRVQCSDCGHSFPGVICGKEKGSGTGKETGRESVGKETGGTKGKAPRFGVSAGR